ncbi:DUF1634 domain-containing protein [Kaistella sp. 97-N-M2]|uniref:DUF1634 domain-containing protein n=1 Tax=Kaistella sp. 97-N-M2 TaxID=2908645 RepID=UPI001F3E2312|nr:DUF1634 domain-containing protein [Kaistella sp. 97-N-M2]UJF30259.1 DUF1634 domain-containing protein [Kaistella sp. 97-N-M2]
MKRHFTDLDLNRSVGNLLRLGVILSVITSFVGFVKLFLEGFEMPKDYAALEIPEGTIWQSFWTSLLKFEGMAIIQLGILLLILTPLVRLLFALVGYLKEKDYTYVIVSVIVLGIMLVSFLMGFAH